MSACLGPVGADPEPSDAGLWCVTFVSVPVGLVLSNLGLGSCRRQDWAKCLACLDPSGFSPFRRGAAVSNPRTRQDDLAGVCVCWAVTSDCLGILVWSRDPGAEWLALSAVLGARGYEAQQAAFRSRSAEPHCNRWGCNRCEACECKRGRGESGAQSPPLSNGAPFCTEGHGCASEPLRRRRRTAMSDQEVQVRNKSGP